MTQLSRDVVISLPQLSLPELQSATFEHYNLSRKGGQARAQDVAGILEGSAREDWIARRELDFLRAGLAADNPELVKLMQSTSPAVKGAILETIYDAIGKSYPALAALATQVAARKKEELAISAPPPSIARKGVVVSLQIEEPPLSAVPILESDSEASSGQLEGTTAGSEPLRSEEPRASVEDELRQIANLQFLAITLMNEYGASLSRVAIG